MHSRTNPAATRKAALANGRAQNPLRTLRHWRGERRMATALRALDDATLKDIGLHRCEIRAMVRAWAAGPEGA